MKGDLANNDAPSRDAKYSCQHCGGHIAFEPQDAGSIIPCPHCGAEVVLASETADYSTSETEPDIFSEPVATGAGLIGKGVTDFKKWSRTMVYHFGESIRPNLEQIWIAAQNAEPPLLQTKPPVHRRRYFIWSGSFVMAGLCSWLIFQLIDNNYKPQTIKAVSAVSKRTAALPQAASDMSEETPSLPQSAADMEQVKVRAEAGDTTAQYLLGKSYEKGNGVEVDYSKAANWYRKAAAQGLAKAQNRLGYLCVKGIGVTQDYAEAAVWFRMAANQGDAMAQCNLGFSYASGKGVPQDYAMASNWLTKAIEQGNTNAVAQLQRLKNSQEKKNALSNDKTHILNEIVANYHKTHVYIGTQGGLANDIYVCGDMACDVWNMVQKAGINAKIKVGNVKKDIKQINEANHAWVLAEVESGKWLALETTGGFTIPMDKNPRYYFGWSFTNPKKLREHVEIKHQLRAAVRKYDEALNEYEQAVRTYNSMTGNHKESVGIKLGQADAVCAERRSDMQILNVKFKESLSED